MDLTKIKRPTSDCGKPVIKLEAYSDCEDEFTGDNYGTGDVIAGSSGVQAFAFKRVTNLLGFVSRTPRIIERIVSSHCRTQKVTSSKIWQIQGADAYPEWKLEEIENMLHAKTIKVDGEEIIYRAKDPAFTQIYDTCSGVYRLVLNVEECQKQQIYGCNEVCDNGTKTFLIPERIGKYDFFTDSKQKIANDYDGLKAWFRNQDGVTDVVDVTPSSLVCSYYKIFTVTGTKQIPGFFYFSKPIAANTVFGMQLDKSSPNYNLLCNGINNELCAKPIIGMPVLTAIICPDIQLGTPLITRLGGACTIVPEPNWTQGSGITSIVGGIGLNEINLSLKNTDYKAPSSALATYTYKVLTTSECYILNSIFIGVEILSIKRNSGIVTPADYTFDPTIGKIDFDLWCLDKNDIVEIEYNMSGVEGKYTLSGQIIARILGGCLPRETTFITNANNADLPDKSTIIITRDGEIKYFGLTTYSNYTETRIDITSIIYEI